MTQVDDADARKTDRLQLRVSREDDRLLRDAAALAGDTLSGFVLGSAVDRARSVMADRRTFELEPDAWIAFLAALDRPAVAKPELAELLSTPTILER